MHVNTLAYFRLICIFLYFVNYVLNVYFTLRISTSVTRASHLTKYFCLCTTQTGIFTEERHYFV